MERDNDLEHVETSYMIWPALCCLEHSNKAHAENHRTDLVSDKTSLPASCNIMDCNVW